MAHVLILLVSLMWDGVQALPVQPDQAVGSKSFSHTVDLAQLARDTVRFCYSPNGHPHEVCKTYVFASTFKNTWQETRDYCLSLGDLSGVPMDLVAIESKEENELIKNHIETNYPTLNWWSSGTDATVPDLYVWASTGYGFTYYDWAPGQPSDPGNNSQTGVLLYHYNGILQWHDDIRSNLFYALCEQNN